MKVETKEALIEVGKGALVTVVGFGMGCLAGHMVKGPLSIRGIVPIVGAVYAIVALANFCLDLLVKFLAKKYDWKFSTMKFCQALVGAAFAVAAAVALFAVGIFGPVSFGVTLGLGLAFGAAMPLVIGLYAKYAAKDLSYKQSVLSNEFIYKMA